jgi:hypothetical protein
MSGKMYRKYLVILIFILCFSIPLVFLSGSVDDFLYQHVGLIEKYADSGHIPETEALFSNKNLGLSAYYAYGVVIVTVANIPGDLLPHLPIAYVSFILILFSLLKYYNRQILPVSIVVLIIATYAVNISYFYFHPHGIGLILLLTLVLLITLMYHNYSYNGYTICAVLLISTISYMSYKALFWAIILITSTVCLLTLYCKKERRFHTIRNRMLGIAVITFLIPFSLNGFFYNNFLPMLSNREDFYLGIDTVMRFFVKDQNDPLGPYNLLYTIPGSLQYSIILRQMIVIFVLFMVVIMLFRLRKSLKQEVQFIIVVALIFVGMANLVTYNLLGLFDIKCLTYMTLIGLLYIQGKVPNNKKVIFNLAIIALIVLNIIYLLGSVYYEDVQKDDNFFEYIQPSTEWYLASYEPNVVTMTDVLTKGYYYKEIAKFSDDINLYPTHFDTNNILMLTGKQIYEPNIDSNRNILYIINYQLNHFSITNWRILKSLELVKQDIEGNSRLNKLYTLSDRIVIYSVIPRSV